MATSFIFLIRINIYLSFLKAVLLHGHKANNVIKHYPDDWKGLIDMCMHETSGRKAYVVVYGQRREAFGADGGRKIILTFVFNVWGIFSTWIQVLASGAS